MPVPGFHHIDLWFKDWDLHAKLVNKEIISAFKVGLSPYQEKLILEGGEADREYSVLLSLPEAFHEQPLMSADLKLLRRRVLYWMTTLIPTNEDHKLRWRQVFPLFFTGKVEASVPCKVQRCFILLKGALECWSINEIEGVACIVITIDGSKPHYIELDDWRRTPSLIIIPRAAVLATLKTLEAEHLSFNNVGPFLEGWTSVQPGRLQTEQGQER